MNVKRPYILWGKVEESYSAITLTVDRVKVLNADRSGVPSC